MGKVSRVYVGIVILLCVSLYNICAIPLGYPFKRVIKSGELFNFKGNDKISIIERNFSQLRKVLPKFGTIGYIDTRGSIKTEDEMMRYCLAKYALAPVLVRYGTNHNFVLVNSPDRGIKLKNYLDNKFKIVYKISNRLILFKKVLK